VILAGRRLNDDMGPYVATRVIKLMVRKNVRMENATILVMGLTFKENCPDLRNTKVVDIIHELVDYGLDVEVFDPWVDQQEAAREYNIDMVQEPQEKQYDGIILAVAHEQFLDMGPKKIRKLGKKKSIIFDVKNILPGDIVDGCL